MVTAFAILAMFLFNIDSIVPDPEKAAQANLMSATHAVTTRV